jgi:tetratricopeptide (TPR) repeat protein
VAAIAVAARAIYLAEIRSSPFFEVPVIDAETYSAMARQIAAGDLAGGDTAYWQPPLYPYLLALLRSLSLGSLGARFVQFLLGATSAVLVARLGREVLGKRAGLLAGIATAIYGPFLFFEGRLLAPALILITNITGLLLLERARRNPGIGRRAIAGLVFGLAAVARPDAFFVALVLGLGLLVAEWRSRPAGAAQGGDREEANRVGRNGAVARAAVFIGAALLVTLPVTARNWVVARDLVWVSANGGINCYIGNNPRAEETVAMRPGRDWQQLVETPHREAGLTRASDRSRYFYRQALRFAIEEPAAYAALLLRKTGRFFAGLEIRRNEDPYPLRSESRLLSLLLWRAGRFGFPFGLVSPLAIVGAVLLWPRRRELLLVYLYAGAYAIAVIAFFVTARYRLPAVPALLILAAGSVDWLLSRRRQPGVAPRFLIGLGFLAVLVGFNPAVPGLRDDAEHWRLLAIAEYERGNATEATTAQAEALRQAPDRAELHYDQGIYLTATADTAGAINAYLTAIALAPDYGEPKVNLGNLLVSHGDYASAVRLFIEAAIDDPDLVPAQIAVGKALLHSGHPDSALARFEQALTLDPESVPATLGKIAALRKSGRVNQAIATARSAIELSGERADLLTALGTSFKDAGFYPQAVVTLKASLRREPEQADAWVTIGQCYRYLDQLEQAEEAQKRAIELDPRQVPAYVNLSDVYARRGLFELAIAELEKAIALDPFHVNAIYNLAVVHAQLGEEPMALLLLEKLLKIDPEHEPGKRALSHLRGEGSDESAEEGQR